MKTLLRMTVYEKGGEMFILFELEGFARHVSLKMNKLIKTLQILLPSQFDVTLLLEHLEV